MAKKKRLKKKQAKKQDIKRLQSVGYTEKEARRSYKTKAAQKELHKIEMQEKRNAERRRRTKELQSLGFTSEQRKKLRSVGKEKYESAIKRKKKQNERAAKRIKKPKAYGGSYLKLLWRDRSEFTDDTVLQEVAKEGEIMELEEMIDNINSALSYNGGEIGEYRIEVTDNLSRSMMESYDTLQYYVIYVGTATRYKHFIAKVGAMIAGIYYYWEKQSFMQELYQNLLFVNGEAAKQFKEDFHL